MWMLLSENKQARMEPVSIQHLPKLGGFFDFFTAGLALNFRQPENSIS
jgi:hypothetical protein